MCLRIKDIFTLPLLQDERALACMGSFDRSDPTEDRREAVGGMGDKGWQRFSESTGFVVVYD